MKRRLAEEWNRFGPVFAKNMNYGDTQRMKSAFYQGAAQLISALAQAEDGKMGTIIDDAAAEIHELWAEIQRVHRTN
jgi:hypothetical protein